MQQWFLEELVGYPLFAVKSVSDNPYLLLVGGHPVLTGDIWS